MKAMAGQKCSKCGKQTYVLYAVPGPLLLCPECYAKHKEEKGEKQWRLIP